MAIPYSTFLSTDGNESGEKEEQHSGRDYVHFGPKCYYDKAKSFFDNISSDKKIRYTGGFLKFSPVLHIAHAHVHLCFQTNVGRGAEAQSGDLWGSRKVPKGPRLQKWI